MSDKKTVILVADVKGWAFDHIAGYLKPLLETNYNVYILYTENYNNPHELLKVIDQFDKIDFIHFFWRGYLDLLLKYIATHKIESNILDKFLKIAVVTSIPDHIFLSSNKDIDSYKNTLNFVENYYTTCKILRDIYTNIDVYPKPYDVIYDNVERELKPNFSTNKTLEVTWVGNSNWGSWYFGPKYDSKGFYEIIKPLFKTIEQEFNIKVNILDGASKKRSKEEVSQVLERTDIVIISAKTEGTPLPLIEAMASACAVITTNVGIAAEVLPEIQRRFIVNRTIDDFINAIKELNEDRDLLKEIKHQNYESYKQIFQNKEFFKNKWISLIENSIEKSNNRIDIKRDLLKNIRSKVSKASILDKIEQKIRESNYIKRAIHFVLQIKIINYIVKSLYFLIKKNEHPELDFEKVSNQNLLIVYPYQYPGVRHSTQSLFPDAILIKTNNKYFALPSFLVNKLANKIIATGITNIIFSGGVSDLRLIEKLHELKKDKLSISYLYHGSPAQWCIFSHLRDFQDWLDMYRSGKIKSIITLKKDLEIVLNNIGIKSYLLQNFVPVRSIGKNNNRKKFTIGLWGAYDIWVKNHYPQVIALKMFKDEIITSTNFQFNSTNNWLKEGMDIKTHSKNLVHNELLDLMEDTDLTLYVTNTECSPMIALESIGLGVPCLVGPTSALYDNDKYLKKMLTVNRVDCPIAIYEATKAVIDNLEEIKSRLPNFIAKYNQDAEELKSRLLKDLIIS